MDFVWDKPPTFKGIFFGGGVQKSVGRLLVLLAETQSYSTSGICSLFFLIENQYRATVQLLRNPAFLIVRGGGGAPPTNQKLGLRIRATLFWLVALHGNPAPKKGLRVPLGYQESVHNWAPPVSLPVSVSANPRGRGFDKQGVEA